MTKLPAKLSAALGLLWRLALYAAILVGAVIGFSRGLSFLLHHLGVRFSHPPGVRAVEQLILSQLVVLVAAGLATLVLSLTDRGEAPRLLPRRPGSAPHFAQGLFWGVLGVGVTVGGIAALGSYRVHAVTLSGAGLVYFAASWIVASAINGMAENLAVLGYPFLRTARVTGPVPAILLVGVLFAAAHLGNPGENPLGLASVFLIAVLLAVTIWLTGDLWLSVGIHAGAVFAEDFLFSVPDSGMTYTGHLLDSQFVGPVWLTGGADGPEGSLVAFPVFAGLLVLLWRLYRKSRADASAPP
ncbi:CPBP family intramembrane glutamic endopeptidase [Phenylobacterium sp.]|jgi:hypothetical protein|uniref:CPBP family intramembrane glutamic endopeptidase n=1 Tax=Phenylobacterium sp. TaxID=1871053 RepID=UPI002F3E5259